MQVDEIVEPIKQQPLFLRLKDVVENIDGWHDHESVYDHSVKTAKIAKEQIIAPFINNTEAKDKFLSFFDQEIEGVKLKDIAIIAALLHDSGKLLAYSDNGKTFPLITDVPNTKNQTMCPGHEYFGGTIVVPAIL